MRVAGLIVPLLAAGLAARADPVCQPVSGAVTTTFTQQDCTSPFGLCTTGEVGGAPLTGSSTFSVTRLEQRGVMLFFSGVFTVTTSTGAATFDTSGAVNTVTGSYVETFSLVSGTGSFEGASGTLVSTGFETATGFSGTLRGALCGG